jgi:hypothetical protein
MRRGQAPPRRATANPPRAPRPSSGEPRCGSISPPAKIRPHGNRAPFEPERTLRCDLRVAGEPAGCEHDALSTPRREDPLTASRSQPLARRSVPELGPGPGAGAGASRYATPPTSPVPQAWAGAQRSPAPPAPRPRSPRVSGPRRTRAGVRAHPRERRDEVASREAMKAGRGSREAPPSNGCPDGRRAARARARRSAPRCRRRRLRRAPCRRARRSTRGARA